MPLHLNQEQITEEEANTYRQRYAVRGVIYNEHQHIAVLESTDRSYISLPGGGVEALDNTFEDTLRREMKEEIGCAITNIHLLGCTREYRKQLQTINSTHGYMATITGLPGEQIWTGNEDNFEKSLRVAWYSAEKVVEKLRKMLDNDNLYERYCVERDLFFVERGMRIFDPLKGF